jgi:DNA-directed RNA polymerase specialized sigma24 family protein
MTKRGHKAAAGEWNGAFHTTHWTEIVNARSADKSRRSEALEELLSRYWKPVYCYLRCKGHDNEAAKDITQRFFHEVVLGGGMLQRADRSRGRFRTFLLACLNRHMSKVQRAEKARRHIPRKALISLEAIDGSSIPALSDYTTPGDAFDYAWGTALLDQVIAEVRAKCCETGNVTYWELFRDRILLPIMENAPRPSLDLLCEKYRIGETSKASHMIFTVKRRFRAMLRRYVRQLVNSDAEVDEEIRYLMKIFSSRAARSR